MFLNRLGFHNVLQRGIESREIVHRRVAEQRGSALVAVIGVVAVGLLLTALIGTSVVGALGFTSATRANVQSQGSADAGIAAARADLYTPGACESRPTPGVYTSDTSPKYTVTIEYNAGLGWQVGCPTATTTQIRIVSTGAAEATGVVGATSGDETKVEAVLKYLTPGPAPSGVAMYMYGGVEVEANSALDLSENQPGGLIIKNGDLYCDKNNTVINGNVVVHGNLTFANKCSVNGNAWVEGAAALGAGSITGDLSAASVTPFPPPKDKVGGVYTQGGAMPTMPEWSDLTYAPADWVNEDGSLFEVRTLANSTCTMPIGNVGGSIPGNGLIINALACSSGLSTGNNTTVKLTSDLVIYAEKFNFGSINQLKFQSSSTTAHRLWFITPDYTADGLPTCDRGSDHQGDFVTKNGFEVQSPIDAFAYTPCAFNGMNGFTWRGQIYAGDPSFVKNNPKFTYVQVGVAGADLDTGGETPVVTQPQPGAVVSMRNLAGD